MKNDVWPEPTMPVAHAANILAHTAQRADQSKGEGTEAAPGLQLPQRCMT